MTWRDDLRRVNVGGRQLIGASFRGAAFFVESEERSGGRRAVVHEFPLRDDPYIEDLGRGAIGFRVEGYVIGDNYLAERDALLDALEGVGGPGELVLPSYGVHRAVCIRNSVRTTRNEGGLATFALEFAVASARPPAPTEVVDSVEQVAAGADVAVAAAAAELAEQYDTDGMPAFALESCERAIIKAAFALASALAPVVTATQELAELTGRVSLMTARVSSLVRQPASVLEEYRGAIVGLADTAAAAPGAVMDALLEAYGIELETPVIATTATRARELANQTALIGALRRMLAIEAARLAPRVPYTSIDEAIAARDQVAEILEEQAESAGDTAYPAIVNLRSEVLRAVPGSSAFARVATVARKTPAPSLVVAYQLYGSVDREADIVARNKVRHPGFVSGSLKVLSDG